METLKSVAEIRSRVADWRSEGGRIGLVPTMGGLHAGHMALVAAARASCRRVAVSLFVNPAQFGPGEDYAAYPRDPEGDAARLEAAGVDVLYAPEVAEMYREGFQTRVAVGELTRGLCGDFRPGHFEGVTTVVAKLFLQVLPDAAFFGEKDYQQLQAIKRLAKDLDIPVAIESVPTVRDADGLALSSRNAYLSADERRIAPALFRTLTALAGRLAAAKDPGAAEIAAAAEAAKRDLLAAGFTAVDYLEVRDAETLAPAENLSRPARALAAVRLGKTRLIDNVAVTS